MPPMMLGGYQGMRQMQPSGPGGWLGFHGTQPSGGQPVQPAPGGYQSGAPGMMQMSGPGGWFGRQPQINPITPSPSTVPNVPTGYSYGPGGSLAMPHGGFSYGGMFGGAGYSPLFSAGQQRPPQQQQSASYPQWNFPQQIA